MKTIKYCNYTVEATGTWYGLTNIQTVLGIVVLILTILNILINSVYKIYTHFKKGELGQIPKVIEHSIDEVNTAVEDFKALEGEDNENK